MKHYHIELKDENGNCIANAFIDIEKENDALINIRYGQFFDHTLKIDSDAGHYRCEIINGIKTDEFIPKTSRYLGLMMKFWKTLEIEMPDLYLFIKNANTASSIMAKRI